MEGIFDRNMSEHPGRVDNKSLFKDDGSDIREHMIDELDYVLVPEEAWKLLLHRFGLQNGQEPIQRKVFEHGMYVKHCVVEVYYIEFQLAENSNLEDVKKKKFSRSDTIGIYDIDNTLASISFLLFRTNPYQYERNLQNPGRPRNKVVE